MWISACEKTVTKFNQIRTQILFEISGNFYDDYRWHGSVPVYLF